jgi:hypothetical protein
MESGGPGDGQLSSPKHSTLQVLASTKFLGAGGFCASWLSDTRNCYRAASKLPLSFEAIGINLPSSATISFRVVLGGNCFEDLGNLEFGCGRILFAGSRS